MSKSYKLTCQNKKCGAMFHRYWNKEEFEKLQYGGAVKGIACFNCGYPKMIVIKSNKVAKDNFEPGYQRNIGKYCATKAEYKAHLKRMGLVEIGNESLPEPSYKEENIWTDEFLRKLNNQYGVRLQGREIEYLKSLADDEEHNSQIQKSLKSVPNR